MVVTFDSMCTLKTAWLLELSLFIDVAATVLLFQPAASTCNNRAYYMDHDHTVTTGQGMLHEWESDCCGTLRKRLITKIRSRKINANDE